MKTLVIHPKDKTTSFLSVIYKDRTDWTVISNSSDSGKSRIRKAIAEHDRIIMMGHGGENGLLGFKRLVIDSRYVQLLRDKKVVCIWCNANKFVEKYNLKGFYTGMIVSELDEADMFIVHPYTLKDIKESNILFASNIAKFIDLDPEPMAVEVLLQYDNKDNHIINFNRENIYYTHEY